MGDTTIDTEQLGRAHQSGADHYRTADMHRATALACLVEADKAAIGQSEETTDPWPLLDKFDRHMSLAVLHARLAEARIGAVRLLMDRQAGDREFGNSTPKQREAVTAELNAWAEAIAPR